MYWSNVLYRFFLLLNMLSLPMLLFGGAISIAGIGERYFETGKRSTEYYIHNKTLLVAIINAILGILIFLFIPATFI